MDLTSELSESKKEGIKALSHNVYIILKDKRECTYEHICKNVSTNNASTANRRIYDILNVMRAVNLVGKRRKTYYLIDNSEDIKKKQDEKAKLQEIKDSFIYITARNDLLTSTASERLYPPFMVIYSDKRSEIHCDTNEERSFFAFKANKPLEIMDDLNILKEIRLQSKLDSKKHSKHLFFDKLFF